MRNPHEITRTFEQMLCEYTGAPFCVTVDNQSNALFLALYYSDVKGKDCYIPKHTYPSVPCEIIHAGGNVKFMPDNTLQCLNGNELTGPYFISPTNVIDSALRFTADMYAPGTYMCLSFTGPYKHLKLGKGGAILTDNEDAYKWFKKARFSGRDECSYHEDNFDRAPSIAGWNFYMMPDVSARGVLLMNQFYELDGRKKHNQDITLKYPDLSRFKLFNHDSAEDHDENIFKP